MGIALHVDARGGCPHPAVPGYGYRGAAAKGDPGQVLSPPVAANGGPRPLSGGQRGADQGTAEKSVGLPGRSGCRFCLTKGNETDRGASKTTGKEMHTCTHTTLNLMAGHRGASDVM